MVTFEQIQKANSAIRTTNIKGKEYAEVNERILAFRKLYPEGFIKTDLVSNENGVCVMKGTVGYYEDGQEHILGEAYAYEKENANFINKGSFIEVCCTSVTGRALGKLGLFGNEGGVASYEEVANAIAQQEAEKQPKKAKGYNSASEPVKSRETAPASSEGHISEKEWKNLQAVCKEKGKDPRELLRLFGYMVPSEVTADDYTKMLKEVCDE